MKQKPLSSLMLVAVLIAATGCASGPQLAWWKKEKAPEDSSAVARSAKPTLPSAASTPQAVAIAGLTPAAPPSSTNLAAAGAPAGATGTTPAAATPGAASLAATAPPSVPIPVTSPTTIANAPTAVYPASQPGGDLADKLVSAPIAIATTATPATAAASSQSPAQVAAVPAAGPYDPNGYRPSAATPSSLDGSSGAEADRYAASPSSSRPTPTAPTSSTQLTSDPADRYGYSPTASQSVAASGGTPITDPNSAAGDRYANPTLPSLADKTPQAVPSPPVATNPTAAPTAAVKIASVPGQYRPGRTSTYNGSSTSAPMEIASRPSAPTGSTTPATTTTDSGDASQPWSPPPAGASPTGTRTY